MRGYFGLGQLSASEKQDILNQHKSLYNGYQTMEPKISNTQPLYVYDAAGDKEGLVVNNKGEVKRYTNMGINEQVETNEVCDECGAMIMDGMCTECNYGHMEEGMGETCEQCGGSMSEGMCNECGSGYMEEETGHLDDIYDEEDLNPNAGFDYIEGSSNDVDTFEGMPKPQEIDTNFRHTLAQKILDNKIISYTEFVGEYYEGGIKWLFFDNNLKIVIIITDSYSMYQFSDKEKATMDKKTLYKKITKKLLNNTERIQGLYVKKYVILRLLQEKQLII